MPTENLTVAQVAGNSYYLLVDRKCRPCYVSKLVNANAPRELLECNKVEDTRIY